MKIIRTINRTQVYRHCNEHGYYTCGNNREYSAMLDKCADYEPIEASDVELSLISCGEFSISVCFTLSRRTDLWKKSILSNALTMAGLPKFVHGKTMPLVTYVSSMAVSVLSLRRDKLCQLKRKFAQIITP